MFEDYAAKNAVPTGYIGTALGLIQRPTMTQRLQERKEHLEHELKQVSDALAMLEQNPQTQQVLDTLAKLNFGF